MTLHGFLRVAAAVPRLRVADCSYNTESILALMERAESQQVSILAFPELAITAYTCADLFQHIPLQRAARESLERLARDSAGIFSGLAIVGVPLIVDDRLFNCAAILHQGRVLAVVPKSFIPNYKEFYENRWFAPAVTAYRKEVVLLDECVPFGTDCLVDVTDVENLTVGVEICEDLWVPVPPSCYQALHGATVLVNLSASNETIGKAAYRRQLVTNQSARCLAAYLYTSSGVWESTTDLVFGGHCLIAENGTLLAESARFQREDILLCADVDLEHLRVDRLRTNSFGAVSRSISDQQPWRRIACTLDRRELPVRLLREIDAHPFVPRGQKDLRERCEEIFQTQVAGLARRLEQIDTPTTTIGISGGLDSTLALLVACKTMDALGVARQRIRAYTMPGFGTTARTHGNAKALMSHLGVVSHEVDIRALCLEEMRSLGHRPFGIDLAGLTVEQLTASLQRLTADCRQDLTFENVQARMRTSILMNAGFVIGTGDLSELALGWCTYNGDHMSMYNPNVSIPKTLVKFLVDWVARHEFTGEAQQILLDIVATDISPELLPVCQDGKATQATEAVLGPYELHDFFLYHFLRYGTSPEKLLFLASQAAFDHSYTAEEIRHWLSVFLQRFFANQFKRSCLPDGPKVGSISLSPRGDWRMPSDAQVALWLEQLRENAAIEK